MAGFSTVDLIAGAHVDELTAISGIGPALAVRLRDEAAGLLDSGETGTAAEAERLLEQARDLRRRAKRLAKKAAKTKKGKKRKRRSRKAAGFQAEAKKLRRAAKALLKN